MSRVLAESTAIQPHAPDAAGINNFPSMRLDSPVLAGVAFTRRQEGHGEAMTSDQARQFLPGGGVRQYMVVGELILHVKELNAM
jgi:hypothetical protein